MFLDAWWTGVTSVLLISTMALPVSGLHIAKRPNSPAVRGIGGRETVGGEMECVEELGKVERSVEDRIQTTTSANET